MTPYANRLNVIKIVFSCESVRTNRSDLRCSPDHLRSGVWKNVKNLKNSSAPQPQYWINFGPTCARFFVKRWATIWHPHRGAHVLQVPALDKNCSPVFSGKNTRWHSENPLVNFWLCARVVFPTFRLLINSRVFD